MYLLSLTPAAIAVMTVSNKITSAVRHMISASDNVDDK